VCKFERKTTQENIWRGGKGGASFLFREVVYWKAISGKPPRIRKKESPGGEKVERRVGKQKISESSSLGNLSGSWGNPKSLETPLGQQEK